MYKCVTSQVDSSLTDLFSSSWYLFHIDLCHFKVSVLVPLQWEHQILSCFGFLTYSHTSRVCCPLIMWPKSNHIAVFALDLKSAYEGEHIIFGLLSPVVLTKCIIYLELELERKILSWNLSLWYWDACSGDCTAWKVLLASLIWVKFFCFFKTWSHLYIWL
jgi:hypothetical protein